MPGGCFDVCSYSSDGDGVCFRLLNSSVCGLLVNLAVVAGGCEYGCYLCSGL